MSSYEFWDELGKIFNAVVAYQEKSVEFNKRFISPWIRLGNVFEKQDRNAEAVDAYEKAIDIDPDNAQNWFELGNLQFKMENRAEAIDAYNRTLELDPGFGPAYSNLGLTLVASGETEQAIPLYTKAIELLREPGDKAVAWNRLGNAYRKRNQYGQALDAFHKADELDQENGGFRDSMDEVIEGPTLMQTRADAKSDGSAPINIRPIELIVAESRANESASEAAAARRAERDTGAKTASEPSVTDAAQAEQPRTETDTAGAPFIEDDRATGAAQQTVSVVVQDGVETFTDTLPVQRTTAKSTNPVPGPDAAGDALGDDGSQTSEVVTAEGSDDQVATFGYFDMLSDENPLAAMPELGNSQPVEVEEGESGPAEASSQSAPRQDATPNSLADSFMATEPGALDTAKQVAYEEYLKDTNEPMHAFDAEAADSPELPGSPEPVPTIGPSGDLQIEMDTKNAHVWNELGNVYFNTSAYDDAIVAYSKAIELDRWLAWPYSNLALAYVQKQRFVEAILLYQRSIELFSSDKDKAISWNRLGNVYRRLNDYDNAIAAYQRADALDPDNSTLSLQSRFSLLGNFATEQKPSYVS